MPRRARISLGLLVVIHVFALIAGFIAPYSFREQMRESPRAAPSRLTLFDDEGSLALRPHVRVGEDQRSVPLRWFVRGSRYRLLASFSSDVHLFGVDPPHRVFLLGTDALGRDGFSRLVYGGQLSLLAGLFATGIAVSIALVTGTLAGYGGRWLDGAIVWASDVFLSLPWLYILLAARAFLPLDMDPRAAFIAIVLLLGGLGWAGPMRIVRSSVRGVMERDHVMAARSAGASHARVMWHHVLPQAVAPVATQAALLAPAYMAAEVTLSFVGLGIREPVPSWGNLLAEAARAGIVSADLWLFAPAFMLVLVTWLYHQTLAAERWSFPCRAPTRDR